jgi:hypothetical protein
MSHRLWIYFLSQLASEIGQRGNRVRHMIYIVQRQTSCYLASPLIALMPTFSTHPSPSQSRQPSPTGGSDGPEGVGAAVWKRRYLALQESVNTERSSKRKSQ